MRSFLVLFLVFPICFGYWGPGRNPWVEKTPESQGLSTELLEKAAEALEADVPIRYCYTVVKNGYLVFDKAMQNNTDTVYEADSAAKQFTSLVIGRAVTLGYLDLDTPIEKYGVTNHTNWGPWFPKLTTRQLLGQVSGVGHYPPGQNFTYDSNDHLDEILYVLNATLPTGVSPLSFASEFAAELGLPGLYKWDSFGDFFTAGGGQMVSCRQLARAGLLIVNHGIWPDKHGVPRKLIDPNYIEEILTPQFPDVGFTYSLLTWVNGNPTSKSCCAPSWGRTCHGGKEFFLDTSLLEGAPEKTGVAMGWLGKYMYSIPEWNLVAVTFGESYGSANDCTAETGCYDDWYGMRTTWSTMRDSVAPPQASLIPQKMINNDVKAPVSIRHTFNDSAIGEGGIRRRRHAKTSNQMDPNGFGSCLCYCPPDQGFGGCVPLEKIDPLCTSAIPRGADMCPQFAEVREAANHTRPCVNFEKDMVCEKRGDTQHCNCRATKFFYCYHTTSVCPPDNPYYPVADL